MLATIITVAAVCIGGGVATAGVVAAACAGFLMGAALGGGMGAAGYAATCGSDCSLGGLAGSTIGGAFVGGVSGAATGGALSWLGEGGAVAGSEADNLGEQLLKGCLGQSFTPTTTVAAASGSVAISDLKVGDQVQAYDPTTGVTALHTVTAVMAHQDPGVEHLSLDSGEIDTTPNHPFFTADRGWVLAGLLTPGEKIRTESGTDATVITFSVDSTPTTMWDLTVDGAHSFFVGAGAVLVHNCARPASVEPDLAAEGPHVTWRVDSQGRMTTYVEWEKNPYVDGGWQIVKRVDITGGPHSVGGTDVPTPHVHVPGQPVRPAEPGEYPQ